MAPCDSSSATLAPSRAAKRESLFCKERTINKWPIALVDRNQVLIVECQMANARGHGGICLSPRLGLGDCAELPSLKSRVESDGSSMSGRGERTRGARILTIFEHGAEGQHDARTEAGRSGP